MDEHGHLVRRLAREKKARLEAEEIVEKATRELFLKNKQIEASRNRLSLFLPTQLEQLLDLSEKGGFMTRRQFMTIVFIDIAGFTAFTDGLEPEEMVGVTNEFFNEVVECAQRNNGFLDKFMGDGALLFFGAVASAGPESDARGALRFASELLLVFDLLVARWRRFGVFSEMGIRIGINSGYCTFGNFGSERRYQYTGMGPAVNLASRLEKIARPGSAVCSLAVRALGGAFFDFQSLGPCKFKGVPRPIEVFQLLHVPGLEDTIYQI